MEKNKLCELSRAATKIRMGVIEATHAAASGHPGGSLSIADIMAYLYFNEMNVDISNPKMADRDRLVLSKGHTAPALYSALANKGFFDVEQLKTLRQADSFLQGHPDMKGTPGVDMTTGSLGLGISAACGMALAGKIDGKNYRVYAILGDGESEEGQVWEAAMFAAHYKLDNLCVIVDSNKLQIDGPVAEVIGPAPFEPKFEAFGFNVITIDGHDFNEIEAAFCAARECKGKPTAIVANTVKGKGVSFMENKVNWHGNAPKDDQYEQAMSELNAILEAID
ncbi:MAG: transketolase [Ruminococcaceae bacterium]|nr:transketolase [Oscillospiraceae bacterium]